jgi:hypothetical protein
MGGGVQKAWTLWTYFTDTLYMIVYIHVLNLGTYLASNNYYIARHKIFWHQSVLKSYVQARKVSHGSAQLKESIVDYLGTKDHVKVLNYSFSH